MLTKMVEITLAVFYRRKDADGNPYGGPTYYMEDGIGKRFKMPKGGLDADNSLFL